MIRLGTKRSSLTLTQLFELGAQEYPKGSHGFLCVMFTELEKKFVLEENRKQQAKWFGYQIVSNDHAFALRTAIELWLLAETRDMGVWPCIASVAKKHGAVSEDDDPDVYKKGVRQTRMLLLSELRHALVRGIYYS